MSSIELPRSNEIPTPRPDIEWVELDGEAVVYDPAAQVLHQLNGTAARVWAMCDGAKTVAAIVGQMREAYSGADDAIERDVQDLLVQFSQLGLLQARSDGTPAV
jgi:hypothetical protein